MKQRLRPQETEQESGSYMIVHTLNNTIMSFTKFFAEDSNH